MPPLIFEPFLRPQVWGGSHLRRDFGKACPADAMIGESWEISAHPLHVSRVAEGPFAGMSLNDLWLAHRNEWCFDNELVKSPRFPLLIKLLDCGQASSLQVHPNNAQAARFSPGESGKTEAWYVLDAAPGSLLYTGLKPGVTEAELRRRLADGTLVDALNVVTPRIGDAFLIPAGVPHAITGGLVLFEIEQCSDITLRLFDWNRVDAEGHSRPLHIEEALHCLDWQHPAVESSQPSELIETAAGIHTQRLLTCEWFIVDHVYLTKDWTVSADELAIWFVVSGTGRLQTANGQWSRSCTRGQTVLAPPDRDSLRWSPQSGAPLELLRCSWGK